LRLSYAIADRKVQDRTPDWTGKQALNSINAGHNSVMVIITITMTELGPAEESTAVRGFETEMVPPRQGFWAARSAACRHL
jgi:hypothetical protein